MRCWILALVMAIAAPGLARADDRQAAGEEFAAGEAADKRRDWRTAIAHYLRAYDLSPHPNALYNVAVDYERLGELRESATYYRRYLDDAPDTEDSDKVRKLVDNLQRRKSRVAIRTSPPGGRITIDGAPAGQAPVTRDLAGGTYTIAAALDGLRNHEQLVVEYGEPADVVIELTAQTGTLKVTSNVSGATVEIDGSYAGTTPLTLAVASGDRKVVVRSDGYSTLERVVKVPGEGSAQITATLVRPLGFVEPPNPAERSYVVSAAVAQVLAAETSTTMVHVGYGYHLMGWEGIFRVGFLGDKTYSYGVLARRLFGNRKIKPFVGGFAEWGGANATETDPTIQGMVGATGGIAIEIADTERLDIDLVIDASVGFFGYKGADNKLVFPIGASIQVRPGAPRTN